MSTIRMLLGDGTVIICAGGGGIPVCRTADGLLRGVEAVVDKDLTAALLARELSADVLLFLTDVPGVESNFGTSSAQTIKSISPAALRALPFPAGSMGPKVEAACRFVEATGHRAVIGRLEDAVEMLEGSRGTNVRAERGQQTTEARQE
jgi:carbamate kinase